MCSISCCQDIIDGKGRCLPILKAYYNIRTCSLFEVFLNFRVVCEFKTEKLTYNENQIITSIAWSIKTHAFLLI